MKNKKATTIKEIAARTGVSIGTVHRAIYGKEGVGETTRRRILEEVEKSNFHINEAASSLKRKALHVAVVLPKAHEEERFFFRGIWEGIKEVSSKMESSRVQFEFIESEYGFHCIAKQLEILYDTMLDELDGIITASDSDECNDWIKRFHKQGVNVVLVASNERVEDSLCSVKVNHEKAGKLAAEFIKTACKKENGKILILTGDDGLISNRNYAGSFIEEFQENQILKVKGFGKKEIYEGCKKILASEKISAIFACNARNTICMCQLLSEENFEKPILLGTDVFFELEPYFESGILKGTIYQSNKEQGKRAVEILYQYLATGSRERHTEWMPIGLVWKSNYEFYMC